MVFLDEYFAVRCRLARMILIGLYSWITKGSESRRLFYWQTTPNAAGSQDLIYEIFILTRGKR